MRPPDAEVNGVRSWKIVPMRLAGASIAAYLINGPFHPLWSWWMVSVVHLRDVEAVPPAERHYPEAEHEFLIVAFNPEKGTPDIEAIEVGEDWGDLKVGTYLEPVDVCVQFHGVGDEKAAEVCALAVGAILRGRMSPDQDYRSAWKKSIEETVDHFRRGIH